MHRSPQRRRRPCRAIAHVGLALVPLALLLPGLGMSAAAAQLDPTGERRLCGFEDQGWEPLYLLAQATSEFVPADEGPMAPLREGRHQVGNGEPITAHRLRVERWAGAGDDRLAEAFREAGRQEVLVVRWMLPTPGCTPVPMSFEQGWAPPGSLDAYRLFLRPEAHWVDGTPTLDAGSGRPYPSGHRTGLERNLIHPDALLSAESYFELGRRLPPATADAAEREAALRELRRWLEEEPNRAVRHPGDHALLRLDLQRARFAEDAGDPGEPRPAGALSDEPAPEYPRVAHALQRFHEEFFFISAVQGTVDLVVFEGATGRVEGFAVGRPADSHAAGLHRTPLLWTSAGDSLAVWWVAEGAEVEVEERDPHTVLRSTRLEQGPLFTPFDTPFEWRNRDALLAELTGVSHDAGTGGSVVLWVFIDEDGHGVKAHLSRSSGNRTLDEAALHLGPRMRFAPHRMSERPVPVWREITVGFPTVD